MLSAWRKRSACCCLAGACFVLLNAPAFAVWLDSELMVHADPDRARLALVRAQSVEQLASFGLPRDAAEHLVDAVLAPDGPLRIEGGRLVMEPETAERVLAALGGSADEAMALGSWLASGELQWLSGQGDLALAHAGKVVGINFTGLLVLLLPITVAVVVALAAGQSAAGIALGALAVGVFFVLLVEPSFLFGEKAGDGD